MGEGHSEFVASAWRYAEASEPSRVLEDNEFGLSPFIALPGAAPRQDVPQPGQAPWDGIGLINFYSHGNLVRTGTGFLTQPDAFLTAAHNLVPRNYDAAGLWMAYDAQRNPAAPQVRIRAEAIHQSLDLAVLIVEGANGTPFVLDGSLAAGTELVLAGYSLLYPNGLHRFSYAAGPAAPAAAPMFGYQINTHGGDSGAPVFRQSGGSWTAVGIHVEPPDGPLNANVGIRFLPAVALEIAQLTADARARS